MRRLIIRSFFEDIKNFKNMIPYRAQKIEEAAAEPLPESYSVNDLATALHPDKQQAIISSVLNLDNKARVLTLSPACGTTLARYRAGQGVNIAYGSERRYFPLLSSPEEKDYCIIVYNDSYDTVSEYLYGVEPNTELEISGPTGLFYYSRLRDGNSVVLICDSLGIAPVLSVCRYLENDRNVTVKVFLLAEESNNMLDFFDSLSDNICVYKAKNTDELLNKISTEVTALSAFFVSGEQSFCNLIKSFDDNCINLRGKVRQYIAKPNYKPESASEKHNCQVFFRDKTFIFDCFENETLLSAFEKNGIPTQARCKIGECGYCRCNLIEGKVETVLCNGIDSRRSADEKYGFIHPCRTFPKTDIKVKL